MNLMTEELLSIKIPHIPNVSYELGEAVCSALVLRMYKEHLCVNKEK